MHDVLCIAVDGVKNDKDQNYHDVNSGAFDDDAHDWHEARLRAICAVRAAANSIRDPLVSPESESDETARQGILDKCDRVDGGHPVYERIRENCTIPNFDK